ncbi:unnamed protein product [Ranitomeya imitator]|uniref:SH3 domain-containing protein n=1 Tax=Ranitomeya imitator TaxID=111125 RepID=A0ABN9M6T9_9NEOB|nr:unnamed protein product [Ranitomeya imitator]
MSFGTCNTTMNPTTPENVKYKEEYEKSKGRSMLEFVDTPLYNVSKEAQKIQSEKLYRKEFEEAIKGKASVDLDLTPTFLQAKHAMTLVSEREYRKDLEEGIKGKGLSVLEDTPDLIRVKNASQILNEKEYRKDFENIKGKGMEFSADIPDMIRAKRATEIISEYYLLFYSEKKEYKKDLETEIKGKGMQVGADILELQHFKRVSELVSQKGYKKDLETEIKGKGMQVGPDIPELQRAKRASEIASQKRYKDEAERMRSTYSSVADTPEIERVKNAQKSISSIFYKKGLGAGTSIRETPEMERVKITQQNISAVKYKEDVGPATAIPDLPEIKRVKEIQKNISNVHYKEPPFKATSVTITPEMELAKRNQEHFSMARVHYKEKVGKVTSVGLTPEMERVKKNQENISSASVIDQGVKYSNDLQQMKGRPSVIVDTPELRHVRETQNHISMIKYHEDFEKTKGRGFTPIADDPVTERVRKNSQIVSDAAYKGVHPHVVEMDRRPGIVVDLKVWRTDPGSIFDIDPLEDNIQSRSLRMLTERASLGNRQSCRSAGAARVSQADDRSEVSEMKSSISYYSEGTKASEDGAPVHPGAYHPSQSQGFGYMNQSSMSSMRSMHSPHAHSPSPSLSYPLIYTCYISPGSKIKRIRSTLSTLLPFCLVQRTFRAMYDYSAQDDDEVSFRDGDYIVNVQPIDEGWMYGTVQRTGKTGMLPANYIEPVN